MMRDACTQILIESKNVFDTSTLKLCDPESNSRELKIKCMHIEWKIMRSCCRMLIGLETSRIVAAFLEPQKSYGRGLYIIVLGSVICPPCNERVPLVQWLRKAGVFTTESAMTFSGPKDEEPRRRRRRLARRRRQHGVVFVAWYVVWSKWDSSETEEGGGREGLA